MVFILIVLTCYTAEGNESGTVSLLLYEKIDQILPNKLHYKIGVTCVYHGHVFYTLL